MAYAPVLVSSYAVYVETKKNKTHIGLYNDAGKIIGTIRGGNPETITRCIDTLRNEKPVYWSEDFKVLVTSYEPVGEGEADIEKIIEEIKPPKRAKRGVRVIN